jgi:hypothetical protein
MVEVASEIKELQKECIAFTNYLIDQSPEPYIIQKYLEAHTILQSLRPENASRFDRFLLKLPRRRIILKVADVYTLHFHAIALLRKKLLLLIALLESHASTSKRFDFPAQNSRFFVLTRTLWNTAGYLILLAAAAIFLGPVALVMRSER